jgi:hypothetical protein
MTFDELWRLNLAQEDGPVDSAYKKAAVCVSTVLRKEPDELRLTAEDIVFLLSVGIKP